MNWQIVIIAAICAVLLGGYSFFTKQEDEIVTVTPNTTQPGFYMKDAAIVETGTDGKPRFTLRAATIAQDATNQQVQLDQVVLNYMDDSSTPWLLNADHGRLQQNTRIVAFTGNVTLQPQGTRIAQPIVLTTDELNIDTEHNLARAPGKVSITMNKQLLTAVGLRADLQRQTIRLESQVHGDVVSK